MRNPIPLDSVCAEQLKLGRRVRRIKLSENQRFEVL